MDTSLFCLPIDLLGEGVGLVVDNAVGRACVSLGRLSLAVAYHDARDVLPHNPMRRVTYGGAGVCFPPDASRYVGIGMAPRVSTAAAGRDLLRDLCAEASRRGAAVHAWTVYLHDDVGLGTDGEGQVRNVYGDPYPTNLCPASAVVRDYAVALTEDILRYPVTSITAEALHYLPFDHGYHHERAFVALPPSARLLLGTCFCSSCVSAARDHGVDVECVRAAVRSYLDPILVGVPVPAEACASTVALLADGEVWRYLAVRTQQVTTLVAAVATVARNAGRDFTFLDLSPGIAGWTTGEPGGPPGGASAWQFGIDVAAIGDLCPILVTAYARRPERIAAELAYYSGQCARSGIGAVLRPMTPDCDSVDNLRAKLAVVQSSGLRRAYFYSYGFIPLPNLDWIATALHG